MIAMLAMVLAVITTPYAPVSYACDGSTSTYAINFPYLTSTDLTVTSTTAGNVVTTLSLTTDYTTSLNTTQTTATLSLLSPSTKCPVGSTLKIARSTALTQPTGFRQQTSFNPATHEAALDRIEMQVQQVQAQVAGTQNVSFPGNNTFVGLQTFTSGNAIDGPVMLTPQASDPTTPANGEVWLNSTTNLLKARINGVTTTFTVVGSNPYLFASSTAGQSIPNLTQTTIIFGTVGTDTDSAYNNTTGLFTVPSGKGGHYALTCSIGWNVGFTATQIILGFQQNGALLIQSVAANPVATQTQNLTGIAKLSAGDTIKCTVTQNQGGAEALHTPAASVYMSIKRLAD